MTMKRIAVLGSTGSIGRQTLDVVDHLSGQLTVEALAAGSNVDLIEQQVRQFRPSLVAMANKQAAAELEKRLKADGAKTEVLAGEEGLLAVSRHPRVEVVVSAIVGAAGLLPTVAAVKAGKDIALANKETLVVAGEIVTRLAASHGVRLLPVDSEHSAIFQCLAAGRRAEVARLLLTASGGPFRTASAAELEEVTVEAALNHPTWNMGGKITIDSATLMNKGLEVIEAHWLFGVPAGQIEVVVHPQSIIHSMVEFVDGSVIAQLGRPDMRVPIQYALTFPGRLPAPGERLQVKDLAGLTFEEPDYERFPCLRLAFAALKTGGTAPAVLNASNEVAVNSFLQGEIGFMDIPRTVEKVLDRHRVTENPELADILASDEWARKAAKAVIQQGH